LKHKILDVSLVMSLYSAIIIHETDKIKYFYQLPSFDDVNFTTYRNTYKIV